MANRTTTARVSGRCAATALLLAVLAGQPAASAPAGEAPVVEVTGGQIQGQALPDRAVFLGVPFAKPPVGGLRWRAPQPVASWAGVRAATAKAPPCLQADVGWNKPDAEASREDCLYLDVATPELKPGAKLPVIVWIHGGANWAGSSGGTVYSSLPKRGVVVVAIQYRLGVLGFLSHPALSAEQGGASGNYGLMDQVAALQWVKANIASFGGDPDNVTIAGQSAGAQDVGLLQLTPLADGLFARAIQESGTAGFGLAPRSLAENEAIGVEIARAAGVEDRVGWLGETAVLRMTPGEKLLAAQMALHDPSVRPNESFLWLQATADGRVLSETPEQALASGRARRPVILGANAREIGFYEGLDGAGLAAAVAHTWGEAASRTLSLYAPGVDVRLGDAALQAATDLMFRCPAVFTAGAVSTSGGPAWLYHFDLPKAGPVSHSSELPYLFDDLPMAPGVTLQAYWANFARTGDPNGPGLPPWPRYGVARAYMQFGPDGVASAHDLRGPICAALGRP